MGKLESVCSPSAVHLDHIADAEVSELLFPDRPNALWDSQVSRFVFATYPNALEDACDLKCASLDAHSTHSNGT
jgi:hypothetical protein